MPLYFDDWQNGEISLVQAANKDAANMDVLDALGPADTEHIRQLNDFAISLYYNPVVNRGLAALERFEDADRTNDVVRKALKLPTITKMPSNTRSRRPTRCLRFSMARRDRTIALSKKMIETAAHCEQPPRWSTLSRDRCRGVTGAK